MAIRAERKDTRPGEFIEGVPNRSLSEEVWQDLTNEQRAAVRECGLWNVKTDAEMRAAREPAVVPSPVARPEGGV